MRNERWAAAGEVIAQQPGLDEAGATRLRLCRNLASLQQHRPAVYRAIAEAPENDCYSIIEGSRGAPTIAVMQVTGKPLSLSANNDPLGTMQNIANQLQQAIRLGQPICLAGIGDGYLLDWLARNPPKLPIGRPHCFTFVECDPRLLLACLMLHDYTGATGPIEQERIRWYVGPTACDELHRDFLADLMLPFPTITVRLGLQGTEIDARLGATMIEANRLLLKFTETYAAHARELAGERLTALMSDHPPRKPRVLLMTTRFSTVLQFATRDSADGFRENGWDARILIEPSQFHALNRLAIAQIVAEFKPDMIFQLDHLRHEHGAMFPANVPFVCWIQDHLSNLTRIEAGQSVQQRDFVLTNREHVYQKDYAYPLRQCIYLDKATRVPPMPAHWALDGEELAFVSNCSRDPNALAAELVTKLKDPVSAEVVREFCNRTIEQYAAGHALATTVELREALHAVEVEKGVDLAKRVAMDQLISALSHPFNDSLYRQQALRWAIATTGEMGLGIGLYGQGWDANPEFAPFSRGYVGYGEELEQLTRRTRINLQIVPFAATHQRLLDGLISGGFFLIREHPVNRIPAELTAFVEANLERSVQTTEHALRVVAPEYRAEFERLLAAYRRLINVSDPVNRVRTFKERSLLLKLPHLDDVCFSNQASFQSRVERFVDDQGARDAIAKEQRQFVKDRFTYTAHLQRVMREIRERIASET